jgi:tRNA(adenine34) deaminase
MKRIRTSVVCVHNNKVLGFLATDPFSGTKYFFLPGGAIEENETPVASAVRETWEETGYRVRVDEESAISKQYLFTWNGHEYDCMTIFYRGFLAEPYHNPGMVKDAPYNHGPQWRNLEEVEKIFGYHPVILEAVKKLSGVG